MLTIEQARRLAGEWAAAWNARDRDAVLSHYTDDIEMSSPFIERLAGEPSGTLRGKQAVRDYWRRALERFPDLHFHVIDVFIGAGSVAILYDAVLGTRAVEVLFLNAEDKVYKAAAHYAGV